MEDSKVYLIIASVASFDYSVPVDGLHKKFLFNGEQIYMDINLGKMAFINKRGANEIYEAYRIELHFPSEHYVTINNQTPRYPLEMQIFHQLIVTDNSKNTNATIKVKRAVVSILFSVSEIKEGDVFFNQLGISSNFTLILTAFNRDDKKVPFKFEKDHYIEQKNFIVASYATGFNIKALQGLLNILNSDHHTYMYYGSETHPPCKEDILWIVFARPRSISKGQFKFIKNQIARNVSEGSPVSIAKKANELFGNKRSIRVDNIV